MDSEKVGFLMVMGCFAVVLIALSLLLWDTTSLEKAQDKACNDIGGKKYYTSNTNYCASSDGFSQNVVFDCEGWLFNKQCIAIPINSNV